VELEALDSEDDVRLYGLVERHLSETDSAVAERLLANWATSLERFVKVMPSDYKRVLEAQQRAAEQGIDPTDAMMEAAHG
jgi:glutamate synthase (NADPH/NADH) large chain